MNERQIRNRYSRSTSRTSVKRERRQGWDSEPLDTFGATVLHRRHPFKDPAVQSRAITVRTRKSDGPFNANFNEIGQLHDQLAGLAEAVHWENVSQFGGDLIRDSWAPILLIAHHFEDAATDSIFRRNVDGSSQIIDGCNLMMFGDTLQLPPIPSTATLLLPYLFTFPLAIEWCLCRC